MKPHKDIPPLLSRLCDKLTASVRTNPTNSDFAGWGQFLDAENHNDQIGTYGTSAALLFSEIANKPVSDPRVAAQISHFLEHPDSAPKLPVQNVRLALMLLGLCRHQDPRFRQLREDVLGLLTSRQLDTGAWPDAFSTDDTAPGYPRSETTAWVMLALHRTGNGRDALSKARSYLTDLITKHNGTSSLSPFALGTLLYTWDNTPPPGRLLFRARQTLTTLYGSGDEGISFFDYLSNTTDVQQTWRVARDYICYPNLLPQSLLLDGLSRTSNGIFAFRLNRQRFNLLDKIHSCLKHQDYFKHSGAMYASSVDQALLALSFDILKQTQTKTNAILYFLYHCYDNRFVKFTATIALPAVLLLAAFIAIGDVATLASAFNGDPESCFAKWLIRNEEWVRVVAGIIVWATAPVPAAILNWTRARVQG